MLGTNRTAMLYRPLVDEGVEAEENYKFTKGRKICLKMTIYIVVHGRRPGLS